MQMKKRKPKKKVGFKLSPLVIGLLSVYPHSIVFAQGIVVDPSNNNGLNVTVTANDTPLVQINNPNANGVSHNKFTDFNVSRPGVVFNNSMQDGVSKIGGLTMKNPNLTQAAKGIISEVTGAKGSRLEGTLEVFGQKADLVIANENGIIVNGISTINTGHLTLSTGQVMQQADGSYTLAVERGNVSVDSGGVSTADLDYFDIVSRSATLNGKISGKAEVKVLTGLNDYDPQSRSHRVRANRAVDTPEVAISGSSMGSMYGNRIQLISTESGAGVRHQGSIISDSDIEISASGDISLAGLKAGQDITVSGQDITLLDQPDSRGISAQRDLFINALNKLTLHSDLVSQQGKIRIDAASLLQQAAVIQTNAAVTDIDTITINVIGDYTLTGALEALDAKGEVIKNAAITLRDGGYVVTVNGQKVAYSQVIADVGVNAKKGNVVIHSGSINNQNGSIGADTGTIAFTISDVFTTNGIIKAQGDISLSSHSLVNSGNARSSAQLKINVSDLVNHGSLSADDSVGLTATNTLDNSGIVASNHSVMLDADSVKNTGSLTSKKALKATAKTLTNKGKVHADGDITLKVDRTLTNQDSGEILSEKTLNIDGQDLEIVNISGATLQAKNLTLEEGVESLENGKGAQLLIKEQLNVKHLNTFSNSGNISAADMSLKNIEFLNNNDDGQLVATNMLLLLANRIKNEGDLKSHDRLSITASDVSNTGGTLHSEGKMQIDADQLHNSLSGKLFSKEDMTLTLKRELNNVGAVIVADGKLNIKGADDAQTLSILNSDSAELGARDVVISSVKDLTNTNSLVSARKNLEISGLDTLKNKGEEGKIQAMKGTLTISDANNITNTGLFYSKSKMTIGNSASLNNHGYISSDGDASIKVKTLDNTGELNSPHGNLQITDGESLKNSGMINARHLTLENITKIDNSSKLQATSQLDIKKIKNLTNSGLIYSKGNLTVKDVIKFINTSASKAKTDATVVAESKMIIEKVTELVNKGDTALINALERLELLDIAQLANSEQAEINGNLVLLLDKIGVLTNLSGANISSRKGSANINSDTLTNSGSYIKDVYDDNGVLIDQKDIVSLISARDYVEINNNKLLTNTDGGGIFTDVGNITINSNSLVNTLKGKISAKGSATIDVVNAVNNSEAEIGGKDISITAKQLINNTSGQIEAKNNALLKLDALTHDGGKIKAAKDLKLDIKDDFSFANTSLQANDNLTINSQGNITNGTNVEIYARLNLHANGDFVNKTGGSIVSANNIDITAANFTNEENTLLWSLGDLSVDVRNGAFINKRSGNIISNKAMALIAKSILNYAGYIKSATDMDIDTEELTNKSIYDSEGWSLADNVYLNNVYKYKTNTFWVNEDVVKMFLPKWQSDISLVAKAEIRSGGEMRINQKNIYADTKTTNTGGAISAVKDIVITGDLINEPEYVTMTLLEYMKTPFDISLEHHWFGALQPDVNQTVQFPTLYSMLDYVYGNATAKFDDKSRFYYVLLGIGKSNNPFEQVMTRLFDETWRNRSWSSMKTQWRSLIQNNGQKIADEVVYFLPTDKGSITTGGTLRQNGGSFSNGITNSGVVEENKVVKVDIGDKTIKTTDVSAQVVVNQKILAVVSMGISTLPTVKELTSIPGMFVSSTAFKKLATDQEKPEDIGRFGATIITIGDASLTIVPMYETRLDMIDKSQFYGSDYFFKQIKYVAEKPVIVIGDAYFINELVNRQISMSVGSFFAVRDGLDNEALVKTLMDNASKVSDKLGLVVGEALTEEQRNNLDEDIVWFVESDLQNEKVLTPVVYLSAQSQRQLRDNGASTVVHANENVHIDATSINNANGVIAAGKNVVMQAEENIAITSSGQHGGVKAGENISMDASGGNISVSGSYLESGGNIDITAEHGDVSFIASMDRDEQGRQLIHSHKDGVSAGGNLNISGKNVEFNAVNAEAGGDASVVATEGNVSFNSLQEIISDREITFKNNGLFSDERIDKQTISGQVLTSNIKAGSNLSIKAKNDIDIEGSEMTAASGDITAGNDINIKTAEDVSWEKTTIEKNELVFSASASGFGHSAETRSSTLDGTDNSTSTGYENNSTEGGGSAGRGKSNGAANIPSAGGFKAGLQKTTETTEKQSTINHNANINFAHSGSLTAGGTADIGGGNFTMDEMRIDAANVASTKYVDETKTQTSNTQEFWGIQGEGHSTVADMANKYTNMGMGTIGGDKEVNGGEAAASVIGDATNVIFNDLAGGSVSMGYERKESGTATVKGQENITNVNVRNLTITSQEDTELNGVEIQADNVDITTGGNLDVNSAKSSVNEESWSATNRAGLSLGAGVGVTGAGVGASVDYSHYEEKAGSASVSHKNSHINAENVNASVGGDMTMAGAHIAADKANIGVGGDLNIVSQQDTLNSTGSSWQTTESLGIALSTKGVVPTFSVGGGSGDEFRNEALVAEQSGISTSGPVNIKTGNDLNITGGHIVSDDHSGSVDVGGDINATTLVDTIEQDGLYGGASAGIDKKGNIVGSGYVKTIEEVHYKENQKATLDVGNVTTGSEMKSINSGLNTDSSSMSEVTENRVVDGNDISWTIGTKLPVKGKGSDSTPAATPAPAARPTPAATPTPTPAPAATPDNHYGNGSGSATHNGSGTVHTESVAGPLHSSSQNTIPGHSAVTSDRPTVHTVHESPSGVPGKGNASGSDSPKDNATTTSDKPVSNKVHESPSDTPDAGNVAGTDATDHSKTIAAGAENQSDAGNGTGVTTRPGSKWTLTPQGNLKGGSNVGPVKDSDSIHKGREAWKQEYDKRNNLKED